MGRVNGHTLEQVIASAHKCHGLVSAMAQDLGVTRPTVYRYAKEYATIQAAITDERDAWIDLAEQELLKAIRKGSIPAIMFFLKTVGKTRGYVERQEITGPDSTGLFEDLTSVLSKLLPDAPKS